MGAGQDGRPHGRVWLRGPGAADGRGDQFDSSSGAGLSYATVMGTGGVVYKFSPETFLGLHYSYANVDNQFNGNTFAFDRQVVQLSLTQAFY